MEGLAAELRTQEDALRAIPPGKRYLSEAEQARAAEVAGPPTLADRESMVRTATQQVGEELDRLEEKLFAIAVGEDLRAEAAGALAGDGRTRSLGERWETCERVKNGVEEELDRREAAIRADSAGEQFLRDARLVVLGSAEREAATLGERARIVKAVVEAKRQAETWNEEKGARVEKLLARPGGLNLYLAHLADRDPKWTENTPPAREHDEAALAAAESDDIRLKRLDAVLSDAAAAACYQEFLDQAVGQFKTSDVDNALAAVEKARAERETQQWEERRDARVKELRALPGGLDLYLAHLADLDPKWDRKRNRKSSRENIDAALAAAQSDAPRLDRLRDVLSDEADAAHYREVLDDSPDQFSTASLDRALAAGEGARAEREASALETTTEEARAAAARSSVKLDDAHVRVIYETGETHESGLSAVERTTAALAAAVDQQLPAATIIDTWKANKSAPGGIASALDAATAAARAADLKTAAEEARAAAARSHIELPGVHLRAIYETGETHAAGLAAVSRTTEALNAAADQRLPADTIIGTWNGNRSAPGGIASALDAATAAVSARRAADLETATEEARAAAARSNVELRDAHVRVIYETGETHESGLSAVERTTAALAAAADQQLPTATIIDTWKANKSAPGGIASALDVATAAAARREEQRAAAAAARVSRLEQLFDNPASAEVFIAALDDEAPSWRAGTRPACIDRALDVAERGLGRRKAATWRHQQQHELVLKAEQQFPGIPGAAWRDAGRSFSGRTAIDRHGESVSLMLSDRARARTLAAEGPSAEPRPARNLMQQIIDWLRTEVGRQQLEALRARTGAARLAQRNRNSVRPVGEKSPPAPKLARLVPDATWEDAEPLLRALADVENAPDRRRLDQRARHAVTAVVETAPPAPKPVRLVPGAAREDAFAAALVRARLPEAQQQRELRLGVDLAARELAGEFGRYQWWSHAGGELEELHLREDRYLDTKEGSEIGMLRTVLEQNVYEKAFHLVEHPTAEPDPPPNLVELVRAFIRRLQDAVDRLIDRVFDREPAHPPRAAAAAEAAAEPARRGASPPPPSAPAPEPALNVTEAERVRVAVDTVEPKLPRTRPYSGNPSYRPPAISDERFDHLAAATDDEFVKTVVTELQRRQGYYTDSARSESEKMYLRPAIAQKNEENQRAHKAAEAARSFFSRRPPEPTWAEAESVIIKEFEAEQLVLIEGVCRNVQQWSPAVVRHKFQRLEPEQVADDRPKRYEIRPQLSARSRDPGRTR